MELQIDHAVRKGPEGEPKLPAVADRTLQESRRVALGLGHIRGLPIQGAGHREEVELGVSKRKVAVGVRHDPHGHLVGLGLQTRLDEVALLVEASGDDGVLDGALIGEVLVERRRANADARSDVAHGESLTATLIEQSACLDRDLVCAGRERDSRGSIHGGHPPRIGRCDSRRENAYPHTATRRRCAAWLPTATVMAWIPTPQSRP